jgi:hypothetical protein
MSVRVVVDERIGKRAPVSRPARVAVLSELVVVVVVVMIP